MTPESFVLTPEEPFLVGESDCADISYVANCDGVVLLYCRGGQADISVYSYYGQLRRDSIVLILPGASFTMSNRTNNFKVGYAVFSRTLFDDASFRLEPAFFHELRENAVTHLSDRLAGDVRMWFEHVVHTYRDHENIFRNVIIRNYLQNLLLEFYDKLQRYSDMHRHTFETSSRQTELFHRFVSLVHDNSLGEREVAFYADKMCISTRYLSTIVRSVTHHTAKEFIDHRVTLEIKNLLASTDLSVQEIAFSMHFPDQSYLGRFFKKHTGMSPTEYRNVEK